MHPEWDVWLWCQEPSIQRLLAGVTNWDCVAPDDRERHASNLIRWHLLATHGGVWVDCDTAPLLPLDDLLDDDRPFCGSTAGPEATIIGGPPDLGLWRQLGVLGRQHRMVPTPALSGAHILAGVNAAAPVLRVFEPGVFFDCFSDGTPTPEPTEGPRRATHRWESSRRRFVHPTL
jgi:Glycosyltransferase sugar-binding region containing DXD motif